MTDFNVLTGLPRSGSTLLCNVLNQRPDTFASSTSALGQTLLGVSQIFTGAEEELSRLANVPGTKEHHTRIFRGIVRGWHDTDKPIVFDKSRIWSTQVPLLRAIDPDAGIIVVIRDPRDVLASIEKQHRATGQYGPHGSLWERASFQMSSEGIVGSAILGVEDILRRRPDRVVFVEYESLVHVPGKIMAEIEATFELDPHEYDFDDVKPTSTDLDAQWRGKFPHVGAGQVSPQSSHWSEFISEDVAQAALTPYPMFCRTFGYKMS